MRILYKRRISWACIIIVAMLGDAAYAEDGTAAGDAKVELEIEKAKLELAKARADVYRALVPDLGSYKQPKPDAPQLLATTGRITFIQTEKLAASTSVDIANVLKNFNVEAGDHLKPPAEAKSDEKNKVFLSSPNLVSYLSSADSVAENLQASSRALEDSTRDLRNMMQAAIRSKPFLAPGKLSKNSRALPRSGPARFALPAIIESGFSIAAAVRSQYNFVTSTNDDISSKIFQSKIIENLNRESIQVYDVDSYLPQSSAETKTLDSHSQKLDEAIKMARVAIKDAAKLQDDNNLIEKIAANLAEQARVLKEVLLEAEKYQILIKTPTASGITLMTSAYRGVWLKSNLISSAQLSVNSVQAASDIVAADGIFSGLRISAAANIIVQWQLKYPDGRLFTGVAQACNTLSEEACNRVLVRPSDDFKREIK